MKKNHFDVVKSYLAAEERFSGMNGDDLELENMSNIDGDGTPASGWDGVDGGQEVSSAPAPRPYSITVANGNTVDSTVVLFGFGRYINATNLGSDTGVTVSATNTSFNYQEFVSQSALQPFTTQLVRIKATDALDATIPDVLNFNYRDIGGDILTTSVYTDEYLTEFANKNGKVSMPIAQKIHGNMWISFTITASKTVVLTFYPATKKGIGMAGQKQYGNAPMIVGAPASGGRKVIAGTKVIPAQARL